MPMETTLEKQLQLKSGVALYSTSNPTLAHIGTSRRFITLPSQLAKTLFKLLAEGATMSKIASLTSIQESELAQQINSLIAGGLIEDESNPIQLSQRFVSANSDKAKKASLHIGDAAFEQLRSRVTPELTLTRWIDGVRDNGASVLNARQRAHIEISGQSRAATSLFSLLLASGVTNTQFGLAHRSDAPLIDDVDIEAGVFRFCDLGKNLKQRSEELAKEVSLFPKQREESAQEANEGFHEQTLKIHFGDLDPQILNYWMSADQPHLVISQFDGGVSTVGPIVLPGVTPCTRCLQLTLSEQSGNIELLEVVSERSNLTHYRYELPVVASHLLAATVASIVLQLIDSGESSLKGSVLLIDHLVPSNLGHTPISLHPACGCSW